ncbi:hypothetical protein Cgig2_012321 [Carnegiea gigantea]|uniref:Uncharacterized protein n=1 Tax=Carnegiea gigantea TaxID=171969 RepID=A0A9Q1JT57_9CARY|nr:hypothetical protein Cgig2_012321 [Carnegiea gigantea]
MVFEVEQGPHFTSLHNDPLAVEMKVASAIVRRIIIDIGSYMDIITWDCLKKLTYPGRDIVPLVYPIPGFGAQDVNLTGVIQLSLCFGDKGKAKNVKVDFLVVGRDELHLFGVPAFRLRPLTLLHLIDASLKVAVLLESPSQPPRRLRPQPLQEQLRPWRAPCLTYPAGLSSRPTKSLSLPSVSCSGVYTESQFPLTLGAQI